MFPRKNKSKEQKSQEMTPKETDPPEPRIWHAQGLAVMPSFKNITLSNYFIATSAEKAKEKAIQNFWLYEPRPAAIYDPEVSDVTDKLVDIVEKYERAVHDMWDVKPDT